MEPQQNSENALSSRSLNSPFIFHFLTLFPESFDSVLSSSLLSKAKERGLVDYRFTQIRNFSKDKHKTVDDAPYGGGEGMLIKCDVLYDAWESIAKTQKTRTILLSPQGPCLTQPIAKRLVQETDQLILVCGHYEGVDERFIELCVDEEISIGDYVLTGGELPAMVLTDVLARHIPGVVGNDQSVSRDSLEDGLLKYPQYTKPREFKGKSVPDVLLSGDHGKIEKWRREQALERTKTKRPDLKKPK